MTSRLPYCMGFWLHPLCSLVPGRCNWRIELDGPSSVSPSPAPLRPGGMEGDDGKKEKSKLTVLTGAPQQPIFHRDGTVHDLAPIGNSGLLELVSELSEL